MSKNVKFDILIKIHKNNSLNGIKIKYISKSQKNDQQKKQKVHIYCLTYIMFRKKLDLEI